MVALTGNVVEPVADLSGFAFFAPVAAFLLVFIVVFLILNKTKIIGENKWGQLFVSFIIASLFVSSIGVTVFVQTIVPWAAVLIISLFFVLLLTGFIGGKMDSTHKGIGITFLIIMGLVFIISALFVFSSIIGPYLPWSASYGSGSNIGAYFFFDWLGSPRILGTIALVIVSALVAWVLVKTK